MSELIKLEPINAIDVFGKEGGLDDIIKRIEEEARKTPVDVTTAEGRKEAGSMAKKIGSSRVFLENEAKKLTEEWRAKTAQVNGVKNDMVDRLNSLRDEYKGPLDQWKADEQERLDKHNDNILRIKNAVNTATVNNFSCADIDTLINEIEELYLNHDWQEFKAPAEVAYNDAMPLLVNLRSDTSKREVEQKELEELRRFRAEQEAKEREARAAAEQKEREERIAQQAAENAKREAEEKARSEALRQERLQQQKDEEERKRQQDEAHREYVFTSALNDLKAQSIVDVDTAITILRAIDAGKISNVKITY